jgi:uncharacterized protein
MLPQKHTSSQVMKYLLLIGLALIILWFFRRPGNRRSRAAQARAAHPPERMVKCARCGIYLPESESIADGAAHFCCTEHRHAAQDRVD